MDTKTNYGFHNKSFDRWIVLAACFTILGVLSGIRYSFGVFFKPLETEFASTRATISSLFSVYMFLTSIFAIVGGWASDKLGPKPVGLTMGIMAALSLFLTSSTSSESQLFVTYSFLLALGTGPTYTLAMSTGSRWFTRYRATALGIIGTGANLGTVIIAPIAAWLISLHQWRFAFLQLGIITLPFVIISSLFLKKAPEPNPDQKSFGPHHRTHEPLRAQSPFFASYFKDLTFWRFFAVWFCYSFCLHIIMSHLVPRIQDLGIPSVSAASVLSLLTGISVPARVLVGCIADRVDKKTVAVIFALLHSAAMLFLIGCKGLWMFYVFAFLYGLANGGLDPPLAAAVPEAFGITKVGTIIGILGVAWGLGAAVGPYTSGVIFDNTGDYRLAFLCASLTMVLAAVCIARLRLPAETPRRDNLI
jgi:MFS family permease